MLFRFRWKHSTYNLYVSTPLSLNVPVRLGRLYTALWHSSKKLQVDLNFIPDPIPPMTRLWKALFSQQSSWHPISYKRILKRWPHFAEPKTPLPAHPTFSPLWAIVLFFPRGLPQLPPLPPSLLPTWTPASFPFQRGSLYLGLHAPRLIIAPCNCTVTSRRTLRHVRSR